MKIQAIHSTPNFTGLISIQGPNPAKSVSINTDNISSISPKIFYTNLWKGTRAEGSDVVMNDGTTISTYLPKQIVIDAYKKAQASGETTLNSPFDPYTYKPTAILF